MVPASLFDPQGAPLALGSDIERQEFIFDINPQSLDLEEPAAVHIVPTQDGGQFIEHHGQIYKNITITGTTGIRPGKKAGDVIPVLGLPNPFAATEVGTNGLPQGEESGFERLLKLRNLFRTYFDAKQDPNKSHNAVLVWENGKEGEFYVVEPLMFRTRRDSSSPLTFNYEIQLRTIQRVDMAIILRAADVRAERTQISRLFERTAELNRKLADALRFVEAVTDRVVGIGQAAVNEVITPARFLLDGLANVVSSATGVLAIPRNSVALLSMSAQNLATALQGVEDARNAYKTTGVSTELSRTASAYKTIARLAAAVHAERTLYSRNINQRITARSQAYRNPQSGPPRTGGSPLDLQNVRGAAGTAISPIGGSDTVFTLAKRLLGDQARWKELVLLNDLKAPYISDDGDGKDVLRPGVDNILFPAAPTQTSEVSPNSREEDLLVQRLGRDFKLVTVESASGIYAFDIAVDSGGDLARIEGVENLAQAVELKFSVERGELPTHPSYGIEHPIGRKANIRSLIAFDLEARASLLMDSRVSNVSKLNYELIGNVLRVYAQVEIAEVDGNLSVSFEARR